MKTLTLLTLTLVLTAAMALTTATAQQYVHTDTLTGHTGPIYALAFKDNGTFISGSSDGTLRAWDVTTGTQRWQADVDYLVYAAALPTHDPFFIAYGGHHNHAIRMRYSDDGDWRGEVTGHTNDVYSLAFKPNSYILASGSADNTIRIWDVGDRDNLRHVRTLRGHTADVNSVAWSPDGRTLASASHGGTVRLWNPNNGINFAVLRGHTAHVYCVAWHPDGRILASGSYDDTIRLWDADAHTTLRVLRGDGTYVHSLAFHPNGQTLASGSWDNIRLWNPNTGAHKATLTKHASGHGLAFSPNGQILAGQGPRGLDISLYRLLDVDVDGDGILSYLDLVAVANKYGFTGTRAADVNKDRKVDIEDIIIVAKAIDSSPDAIDAADAAAIEAANADEAGDAPEDAEDDDITDDAGGFPAPAKRDIDIGRAHLWAADVQQWLRDAKAANANPAGIAALEQLLATLNRQDIPVPKETALLANYPNPFNPETWIPFRLGSPDPNTLTDVTLSIHTVDGKLVRALELGQMPAGVYQSRSRAAYWDGRNAQGEPVASGVYFYTLKAGEFSATRKMLIRK